MDSVAFESWIVDGCSGYEHNTRGDGDVSFFGKGFTSCSSCGCAYGNNIEYSLVFNFQFPNGDCDGIGGGDGTGHGDGYNNDNQFLRDLFYGCGYGYGAVCYGRGNNTGAGEGWYTYDIDDHYYSCRLITHNNQRVYYVDSIPCLPRHIRNNLAFVNVIGKDMRLYPMVIAKGHGLYAHGKTIKEAVSALEEKHLANIKPTGK